MYLEIRILHDFEDRNRFGLGLYYVTTNYLIAPVCIVCSTYRKTLFDNKLQPCLFVFKYGLVTSYPQGVCCDLLSQTLYFLLHKKYPLPLKFMIRVIIMPKGAFFIGFAVNERAQFYKACSQKDLPRSRKKAHSQSSCCRGKI